MKTSAVVVVVLMISALFASQVYADSDRLSFGGGIDYGAFLSDQKWTTSGTNSNEAKGFGNLGGFHVFMDITKYFTLTAGLRIAVGDQDYAVSGPGYSTSGKQSWNVWDWEIGVKAKYPFEFARGYFLTPTIGLDWLNYGGGHTDRSPQLSSDEQQIYGPSMFTLGYEFTAYLTDRLFLRFPFDIGWGLNTKVSDGYYSNLSGGSPASYDSSSLTFLSASVLMGYSF